MASKQKLKRKLRKQKTRHLLEVSDLHIQLDKAKYDAMFHSVKVSTLQRKAQELEGELDSVQRLLDEKWVPLDTERQN